MLVGFLRFCAYVLDVCAYNESAVSFQPPTDDQSPSVSVCLDTITTRFLCFVSHNALLLTITFLKKTFSEYFWKHINTVTVFGVVFKYSKVYMYELAS